MINTSTGTPFVGYASLTNGAPGPISFALFVVMGKAAYVLAVPSAGPPVVQGERAYITNITISSSDTATNLVTVDSGGTTPTKFASAYISSTKPLQPVSFPPGTCRGIFGVAPRATAAAVSTGTVEVVMYGYISKT